MAYAKFDQNDEVFLYLRTQQFLFCFGIQVDKEECSNLRCGSS